VTIPHSQRDPSQAKTLATFRSLGPADQSPWQLTGHDSVDLVALASVALEALWRAWEYLRLDAHTGMSVWFRDHADHHMAVLLSADGAFKGCKPDRHGERLEALPLNEPPDARATLR
jgi:hypothetical protein